MPADIMVTAANEIYVTIGYIVGIAISVAALIIMIRSTVKMFKRIAG